MFFTPILHGLPTYILHMLQRISVERARRGLSQLKRLY
jgi:hypothetical protein